MSLDKSIKSGKEHRKPFYGAKAFDTTCRCNGSCGYCEANRLFSIKREQAIKTEMLEEYELAPLEENIPTSIEIEQLYRAEIFALGVDYRNFLRVD